jgi:hypothetical protein
LGSQVTLIPNFRKARSSVEDRIWVTCISQPDNFFKLDKANCAVGLVVALMPKEIKVSSRLRRMFFSFKISLFKF